MSFMTTIILASIALFALTGLFWARIDKTDSDTKKKLKNLLLGEIYTGVVAISGAVIWIILTNFGYKNIVMQAVLCLIGFVFIGQVAASYWLLYRLLNYSAK
jgi:hypothetical protein